jgi:cytochrome b subunit of formate dehydrogenase
VSPRRRLLLWVAFLVVPGAVATAAEPGCPSCHGSADTVGDRKYVVDMTAWKQTVHGAADVDCDTCHAGHEEFPHEESNPATACRDCHSDAAEGLATSVHRAIDDGGVRRPGCTSCHGPVHAMRGADDEASPVHPKRLAATCAGCHADPALGGTSGVKLVQPIAAYAASVHARSVAAGGKAATCSSCHGSHDILSAADPRSRVNRRNVPATCAACHGDVARTFQASVHGQAAARGIREAPVCTDCHGEHRILGPADKGSPVFATNVPKMACGRCHGDLRVTEKFGMKSTAVVAFADSFHGLASKAGNLRVANCASCHGVHDILPSSDPRSHVNPANLADTCGACHPGAGSTFAIGAVHVLPEDRGSAHPAVYWVRIAYLTLIWVVIGGMTAHNVLDLGRKARSPAPRAVVPVAERRARMSLGFRLAHGLLFTSFSVLVWSGFALTYQDAWWAAPLLAWEEHLGLRGWLHRCAAVVLLASGGVHVAHLAVDRRARACIRAMLPAWHDLRELRERVRWYVGARADMPRSPALGYVEKLEYLAVVWGTLVMAASGFVLWFDSWSLAHLPKWLMDVATVVHFYEAVLATLAIVVWHFYSVIFDPLVYPMDTAWLTGRESPGRTLERTDATVEPPGSASTPDDPGA